jgi:hypothetical protein
MRVCDWRVENNRRKVAVLGAPPCVHMKTKVTVSQEQPRNVHYLTGRCRLNLIKFAFRHSLRIKKKVRRMYRTRPSVRLYVTDFL